MLAIVLMLGLLSSPLVLWFFELNTIATFVLFYVALSLPSIAMISHEAIKNRAWPKITGGPSFFWAGKRIGF